MNYSQDYRKTVSGVVVFCLITVFFSVLFSVYPRIDIHVSGFFHDPQSGFYLRKNPFIVAIYNSIEIFIPSLTALCFIALVLVRIRGEKILGLGYSSVIYLLVTLAIGPGLLINGVLKEFWGRARPATIEEFGGTQVFTPVLVPSDQCDSNCSFASGHASAGFFPLAMSFVWKKHRKKIFFTGIVYGLLTGFARIVQGGHFFSDVVFAGLIVYGLSWLIWRFFDNENPEAVA